jgi:phenylacetate-CoA ligase
VRRAMRSRRCRRTGSNARFIPSAKNVPAYRKKFDAAGVKPSDFRRLEDLQKFPFTTKQDLRDNYPFGMFAVPKERVARVGKPTVVVGCMVVPIATGMTERQVQLILDFKPEVIIATPSYLIVILDEFRARGVDPSESSLKIASCGAEPWTNATRAEIENNFNIDAMHTYGLSELIGPGVASECGKARRVVDLRVK